MKVWVVIPAYNEGKTFDYDSVGLEKSLDELLRKLKGKGLFTLVIDDGSKDNTFEIVKKSADIVLKNEENLGKGRALKNAINYLLENDIFDYIITMDADRQHCLSDIEGFLKEAEKGEYFVVGNRMGNPVGMPKIRIITNRIMSWIISEIVGQKIPDTQCGFRLIKKDVLEKVEIKTKKFEIESEILIKSAREGFVIKSIPIKSIYFKDQKSKISPFRDTLRFIKFISAFLTKKHPARD